MKVELEKIPFNLVEMEELINKEIVIWGTEVAAEHLKFALNIPYRLLFYCDSNEAKWGQVLNGIDIISPSNLKLFLDNNPKCIVIVCSEAYPIISKQLRNEFEIRNRIIDYHAIIPTALEYQFKDKYVIGNKELEKKIALKRRRNDVTTNVEATPRIVTYSAPKTGNTSVNSALNNKELYRAETKIIHSMDMFFWSNKEKEIFCNKAKKIIIGVRDAIMQNISLVYQGMFYNCLVLGKQGRDAQKVFQYLVNDSICFEAERRKAGTYGYTQFLNSPCLMQSWFDDEFLKEFNIDLLEYPFDKEKGYAVYQDVNGYDILIYQMEKMNTLTDVFREFTGKSDFEIKRENDANDKWYADSYNYFKKNVKMSREYVEKTYNGKMMQHFYSQEDIGKFRKKLESHIYDKVEE